MNIPKPLIGLALLVVIVGGWFTFGQKSPAFDELTLTFHAKNKNDDIVFNDFIYENPGGVGLYRLRDFRFYLSNIQLLGADQEYSEPDSYHLVRFDNPDRVFRVTLTDVPLRSIEAIRFMIGIDAEANASIETRGDLDPNSQMAWNWEVGYKFVVFEGALQVEEDVLPLVYHVGFSENSRWLEFNVPREKFPNNGNELHFDVDVAKIFDGQTRVDLQALQSIKFDREDASMMAKNYAEMVSPSF